MHPNASPSRPFVSTLLLSTVLFAAALLASPALADGPGAAIGLHGGYLKSKDAEEGGFATGAFLELRLASIFALQGGVGYQKQGSFTFPVDNSDISLDVSTIPMTASFKLTTPGAIPFHPYALAGGGWYRTTYDFSSDAEELLGVDDKTETNFGWHAGAGISMSVAPKMALFGEFRTIFLDPEKNADESWEEIQDDIESLDFDSYAINVGLSLSL